MLLPNEIIVDNFAGGGGASASPQQQEVDNETSDLSLTVQDDLEGASQSVIRFDVNSGDALLDAIAGALNEGQRQGR